MQERMQKTSSQGNDCPQRDRTESEGYEGVQTYIWMTEDNVVEVPFDKEHLLEAILSPKNLNDAYKCVVRNKGCGGVDKMSCEQLLPWLRANKDTLIKSLMDGSYRPNPVRRVEIPKARIKNLIKCGINKYNARRWGYVKGYWGVAGAPIMHVVASKVNLRKAGYTFLYDEYVKWLP